MPHWYLPSGGQPDAVARAAALGLPLADAGVVATYSSPPLPCAVCDHDGQITYTAEPTTFSAVWAAHDAIPSGGGGVTLPTLNSTLAASIAAHSIASNPHGLTPAAIGAATAAHTHTVPVAGIVRKTANQTMTLTGQTAVTDMSFPVDANATYYFRMDLVVTTSTGTSPTTNWGFTGPASPTAVSIVGEIDTSTSVESSVVITSFTTMGALAQVANTGAKFQGTVQTTAAGTVQLTVARGGTNPSMVIAAGSNGMWMRVA